MKIVVTGMGMVSALGKGTQENFEQLCAGHSGVAPLRVFQSQLYGVRHAYEINDRVDGQDRPARASEWLAQSIHEALAEARFVPESPLPTFVGTGLREFRSLELQIQGHAFSFEDLHFDRYLKTHVSSHLAVKTLANACAASNFALGLAFDVLQLGQAETVIAAGCDAIAESMFGLMDHVTAEKPSRIQPFAKDRKGVIMGEGAVALVLETEARAKARGATILATIHAVGMSCDAYHETAPHKPGIQRAVRDAYQRAQKDIKELDLIMLHGTGTALNDDVEASALSEILGSAGIRPSATAIKSMTGHTSGASGLMGVVTAIAAMRESRIPPTPGVTELIPAAEAFHLVVDEERRQNVRLAQVNAFGFGGVNAVVVLGRDV